MNVEIVISLCIFFFQQSFISKTEARQQCLYRNANSTLASITCNDDCCSNVASSSDTACCSGVAWSSLAIPFFVVAGVCMLAICLIYCRPLWKMCLCGHKCPCGNRTRVTTPTTAPSNENPAFVLHNDDLPDYETITKDSPMKDITPPPYNFVAAHPNDFGIETRVPSAPPQYRSRRNSLTSTNSTTSPE